MSEIDKHPEIETVHPLDRYRNHLEFLGYTIEEDSDASIFAKHHRKENLWILKFASDIGILARITYAFPPRFNLNPSPLYVYANDLNIQFYFMKACVLEFADGGYFIRLESFLEGGYDRRNFSIFLDNLERDLGIFRDYLKTGSIFSPDEEGQDESPF